jgi:hypothetical protein
VLAACVFAGLACQQIVGITDRKIAPGSTDAGNGSLDAGHPGSPIDVNPPRVDTQDQGRDAPVESDGPFVVDGAMGDATGNGGVPGGSGGALGTGGAPSGGGAGGLDAGQGGLAATGGLGWGGAVGSGGVGGIVTGGTIGSGGAGVGGAAGGTVDASLGGGVGTGGFVGTGGVGSGGSSAGTGGVLGFGGTGTGGWIGTGGVVGSGGITVGTGGVIGSGGVTVGTGGMVGSGGATTAACNDGVKSTTEQCDGVDLGGKTCASIGLGAGGSLGCAADCTLDTSGCHPTLVLFGGRYSGSNSSVLGDTWEYANGVWREMSPLHSPGARWGASLASINGTVVLFGGYGYATPSDTAVGYRSDTWVWDGNDWTKMSPTHVPPSRYSAAMGTLAGKAVMFGGWGGSARGDTWEWDGNDWTDRSPAHAPAAADAKAAANLGGERLMVFGAGTETWEWDGNDWLQRTPSTAPADRKYLRAATTSGGVIMFGGSNNNTSSAIYYPDTWRWDGSSWTQLLPDGPPPKRRNFALASLGKGALMVGGYGPGGAILDDVWEWTGATWVPRTAGPSARHDVCMAAR